jgi:hypothetical protein
MLCSVCKCATFRFFLHSDSGVFLRGGAWCLAALRFFLCFGLFGRVGGAMSVVGCFLAVFVGVSVVSGVSGEGSGSVNPSGALGGVAAPGGTASCFGGSCDVGGPAVRARSEGPASRDIVGSFGRLRSLGIGGRGRREAAMTPRVWRLLSRRCFGPR